MAAMVRAGGFRHGGGGCQGRRRPSTIVVLGTKVPIPTYVGVLGVLGFGVRIERDMKHERRRRTQKSGCDERVC